MPEGYVTQRQYDELLQVFRDLCESKGAAWLERMVTTRARVYRLLKRSEVPQLDGAAQSQGWRCSDCHRRNYHAAGCETAQLLLVFGPDDEAARQAACARPAALREAARRAGPRLVRRADGGTDAVWDGPAGDDD